MMEPGCRAVRAGRWPCLLLAQRQAGGPRPCAPHPSTPHPAPQAKKAAKKQQLLQRISSGEQGTAVKEAGLLPLTQQQQQNGHGHGLAVGGGHKETAVDSMADAVALLRAAEKLGNK